MAFAFDLSTGQGRADAATALHLAVLGSTAPARLTADAAAIAEGLAAAKPAAKVLAGQAKALLADSGISTTAETGSGSGSGGGQPDTTFLYGVYQGLFDRAPDADGLRFWLDRLEAGHSRAATVVDIIAGAQGDDSAALAARVAAGRGEGPPATPLPAPAPTEGPAATLNLSFDDPAGHLDGLQAAVGDSMQAAWDLWARHFDLESPAGIEIEVGVGRGSYLATAHNAVSWTASGRLDGRQGVPFELATGQDANGDHPDAYITLSGAMLDRFEWRSDPAEGGTVDPERFDALTVFQHELGHVLGVSGFLNRPGDTPVTRFDGHIDPATATFAGPATLASVGPMPLDPDDFHHTADSDSLMASSLSPGEVRLVGHAELAMIADAGVPVAGDVFGLA